MGSTVFKRQYGSRQVLELLAEKWIALVLHALARRARGYGELRREVAGILQKRVAVRYASRGNAASSAAALLDSRS